MADEYADLKKRLALNDGLPYTPNWSAASDFLEIIVDHCLEYQPSLILECGSGLSTIMLARCCQMNGKGRIISLEDGAQYVDRNRSYTERYRLDAYADIVYAPLIRISIDGVDYQWYSMDDIPVASIDMLVIDGPSGFIQKNSRYPALPLLESRLSKGCHVFLDDASRQDEQEIVMRWMDRDPDLRHEYIDNSRGCSVLVKGRIS